MTAQIPDAVRYEGKDYAIAGVAGSEVLELIFIDDRLEKVTDHSPRMAEIRSEIVSGARKDPDGSPDELIQWIDKTFQLDYSRSYL